jgi:hypothetical protein
MLGRTDAQRNRKAAGMKQKLTRRQYLIRRALIDGASTFGASEAVSSVAMAHPEWDMNEERTWEQWEQAS